MKLSDVDYNKVTPMMRQYIDIKKGNPKNLGFLKNLYYYLLSTLNMCLTNLNNWVL